MLCCRAGARMRFVLLAVAVGLASATVACGGGDSTSKSTSDDQSCTNDPTATAIVGLNQLALTPDPSGTRAPFHLVDDELDCRLRKVLLGVDDLPTGWRLSSLSADGLGDKVFDSGRGRCAVPLSRLNTGLR